MSFTGKATYTAGATLPEIAEDVSDIIGIVSPFETPLLDHLGDPQRSATSTVHEWLEDQLVPNVDAISDGAISNPVTETQFDVANGDRFQIGDQVSMVGASEMMLVTAVSGNTITVTRGYGGTTASSIEDGAPLNIHGCAALEGGPAPASSFTSRTRRQNYTQIFTATIEISGSQLAAHSIAVADEMDYQKQERLRELLRDLENSAINGVAAVSNPQGGATTRRSMRGIIPSITTNIFAPDDGTMPEGGGAGNDLLTEELLNAAMRAVWEQSSGGIDTIVCGGFQKRQINQFISSSQRFVENDGRFSSMVEIYESDFGVCRVLLSRWVPPDKVLLLDSSRIDVLPLSGRSFHFKPLASTGDSEIGQVIGEYTLEFRNENAHAVLGGLGIGST